MRIYKELIKAGTICKGNDDSFITDVDFEINHNYIFNVNDIMSETYFKNYTENETSYDEYINNIIDNSLPFTNLSTEQKDEAINLLKADYIKNKEKLTTTFELAEFLMNSVIYLYKNTMLFSDSETDFNSFPEKDKLIRLASLSDEKINQMDQILVNSYKINLIDYIKNN